MFSGEMVPHIHYIQGFQYSGELDLRKKATDPAYIYAYVFKINFNIK